MAFILFCDGIAFSFVAPSPQTLFRRFPRPPTATSQARNGPGNSSYVNPFVARPSAHSSTITTAPVKYPQDSDPSDFWCLAGTPGCSGTKTWDGPSLSLSDQCVLWDSSCTGDLEAAARNFFENMEMMNEKPCWKYSNNASFSCTVYELPETLSAMSKIKEWMRGTQCLSLSGSLHPLTTTINDAGTTLITTTAEPTDVGETCCGNAIIKARNVDIYYWPEPGADTSCLSIVGNSVNPLYYGATMGTGPAYWGCTAKDPRTSTLTSILDSPGTEQIWTTVMDIQSIITTARITEVNSLTFKIPLINPWSPPACIGLTSALTSFSASAPDSAVQKSIHARGHSLAIPSSMTQEDGLPVRTVVSGAFTFTSPSIYANFHSISAADWCGEVGSEATITQTMLTFSSGELSTIAGPLHNPVGTSHQNFPTRVFDFADLPCPPQSVMEENWYKPAPGEPYRPLIALPKKVMDIDPAYASVSDAFFTAYDPPSTLMVATAMVPDITSIQTVASPVVPTPGPNMDAGASRTTKVNNPHSVSVHSQDPPQPMKTTDPGSDPRQNLPSHQPHFGTEQQEAGPEISYDPNKQSGTAHAPELASQSSKSKIAKPTNHLVSDPDPDPERASPDQMSRVESALAPKPQSQLTIGQNMESTILQTGLQFGSQQTPKGSPPVENAVGQQSGSAQSFLFSSASGNPEVYISAAVNAMDTYASGLPKKTDTSATAPRAFPSGQSNLVESGDPIVHQSDPESILATSLGEHAIQALSNAASIQGNTAVAEAAMTISGAAMSVDLSHSISLRGTQYPLPTSSPAPTTTLVHGAVAVPLPNGDSVDGNILTTGAAAIFVSGTPISFDASSNFILGDSVTNIENSPAFTDTDPSNSVTSISTKSPASRAVAAATNAINVDTTSSRSAPAVTVNRMPVSLDSAGKLGLGSQNTTLVSSDGGLGSLIVGGLQTGGLPSNSALTTSQGRSTTGANGDPGEGHTLISKAESAKSPLPWKTLVACVAMITIWLHI